MGMSLKVTCIDTITHNMKGGDKMNRIEMQQARKSLGKSQRVMSIELELSESYIRQIEYGVKEPGGKTMLKISKYLGVPAEILFKDLLS